MLIFIRFYGAFDGMRTPQLVGSCSELTKRRLNESLRRTTKTIAVHAFLRWKQSNMNIRLKRDKEIIEIDVEG